MEINQLKYFLALSEQEHMSRTADFLNISQPALSRSISRLEKELGVDLFEHYGNRIYLSEDGKEFAEYARKALQLLEEGAANSHRNRYNYRGCLRFACRAFSSNIIPCINAYMDLNPGIQLKIFQNTQSIDEHLSDNVDFVLTSEREAMLLSSGENSWFSQKMFDEDIVLLVSVKYREFPEDVTELDLLEFSDAPFLGSNFDNTYYSDITTDQCYTAGFSPRIACVTDNFNTAMQIVGCGKAVTIISAGCVSDAQKISPDIRAFRLKGIFPQRAVYLVRKNRSLLSESCIDFWNFFLDYYGLPADSKIDN